MPTKLQPALYGGAFIGVLSALPFVSAGNVCCCLWVVSGGAIAAYLMQQNHPDPITIGDGAVTGFLSGVIGSLVYLIVSLPFSLILGPMQRQMMDAMMRQNRQDLPREVQELIAQMSGGAVGLVLMFLLMLVAGMVFATIGGVIGAAVFKKSGPPATPPGAITPPPTAIA